VINSNPGLIVCVGWGKRNAYWIFMGKGERKKSVEKRKRRWEGSVKTDLKEV
jgi:hypothetical protein